MASWLDARAHQGVWRLRIDDLDGPRSVPGAVDDILRALDAHALHWDGPVVFQSDHAAQHGAAVAELTKQSLSFRCTCSRKELREHPVYPGTCRERDVPPDREAAMRIRAPATECAFVDRVQGRHAARLAETAGDFIILRRDGIAAYPLAVVVDDAAIGVTDVVRGADLLDQTPRQLFVAERLGLPVPRYLHLPVLADRSGDKLSKRTAAATVAPGNAPGHCGRNVQWCLDLLGMGPPRGTAAELLAWAVPAGRARGCRAAKRSRLGPASPETADAAPRRNL